MKHLRSIGSGLRGTSLIRGEVLESRHLLAAVAFAPQEIIDDLDADGPDRVVAADIDGDGDVDAVIGSYRDNQIAWYENSGSGRFTKHFIADDASEVRDLTVADFDGDGDVDIAVAAYGADSIRWYRNLDGRGTFDTSITIGTEVDGVRSLSAVDIDQDGDVDLVSGSWFDGKIAWYENLGHGNFAEESIITNRIIGAVFVHAEDLDGDGDQDVISASASNGIVAWYENIDGKGDFGPIQILTRQAIEVEWVTTADLDGDGDPDILSASYGDGQISWFENQDGQGDFSSKQNIANVADPTTVEAIDLDRDGDLDLVATLYKSSLVVWIENLGATNFADPIAIAANAIAII